MIIVIEFTSLDGVVEDPDGSGGQPWGGWAFRHGPEAVAGDKFALGPLLDTGVMLLGRTSWQLFSKIWPGRTDEFSRKMNALPKLVASRSLTSVDDWENSTLLQGDLREAVAAEQRDVIITGSMSLVEQLGDLVDEYRLVVFPTVVGAGRRLFTKAADLELVSTERLGQGVRLQMRNGR